MFKCFTKRTLIKYIKVDRTSKPIKYASIVNISLFNNNYSQFSIRRFLYNFFAC